MNTGEVISILAKAASKFSSEGGDELLMMKSICNIDVGNTSIDVYFTDGNTPDIRIDKEGNVTYKYLLGDH